MSSKPTVHTLEPYEAITGNGMTLITALPAEEQDQTGNIILLMPIVHSSREGGVPFAAREQDMFDILQSIMLDPNFQQQLKAIMDLVEQKLAAIGADPSKVQTFLS